MIKPYIYRAKINRIVDGDTIIVDIDLGFGVWLNKQRIRFMGVDTPESRTRDLTEKKFGLLAKKVVSDFCPIGDYVMVETNIDKNDKFGRILGIIWVDPDNNHEHVNLNEYLIAERYAVAYQGQNKQEVADQHLSNYKYLIETGKI